MPRNRQWELASKEAQCGFDPAASPTLVVSDKHVPNETWAKNAGCSVDSMAKDCCHRFIARTSYAKEGFVARYTHRKLLTMHGRTMRKVIDPNTCTFDEIAATDPGEHPAVLHTAVIDNNSTFTVSLSNLSSQLYTHATLFPVNWDDNNAVRCANPRTCGHVEACGGSASRFLLLVILIIAVVLVTVARRAWGHVGPAPRAHHATDARSPQASSSRRIRRRSQSRARSTAPCCDRRAVA